MAKTMPIIEARNRLTTLPEQLAQENELEAIEVTRRGKPVLAIMPWDLYEALIETLEILGDADLTASLRQSIREAAQGDLIPWEAARTHLAP